MTVSRTNITYKGNTIEMGGSGSGYSHGIDIESYNHINGPYSTQDITVDNNTIKGGYFGINLYGIIVNGTPYPAQSNTITNNTILNFPIRGVTLTTYAINNSVTNNSIQTVRPEYMVSV